MTGCAHNYGIVGNTSEQSKRELIRNDKNYLIGELKSAYRGDSIIEQKIYKEITYLFIASNVI